MAWHPGVHDPTVVAWLVTAGYLVVALMCFRAWRRELPDAARSTAWLVLATLLLGLGINKQLDVQTLAIDWGRDVARRQGWLAQRRMVLDGALLLAGVVVATVVFQGWKRLSDRGRPVRVAVALVGLLVLMLLVQAGNFGRLSEALTGPLFTVSQAVLAVPVEELLELAFLFVIGWSARRIEGPGGQGEEPGC